MTRRARSLQRPARRLADADHEGTTPTVDTLMGNNGKPMSMPNDITAQLAHHDAAITALGGRMTGVETGLRTLQGEVHHGFANVTQNVNNQIGGLASKLDKLDGRPQFDFHKTIRTVQSLAILFAMVCGGIIWITTSQFGNTIEEVKRLKEKMEWVSRVEPVEKRK